MLSPGFESFQFVPPHRVLCCLPHVGAQDLDDLTQDVISNGNGASQASVMDLLHLSAIDRDGLSVRGNTVWMYKETSLYLGLSVVRIQAQHREARIERHTCRLIQK